MVINDKQANYPTYEQIEEQNRKILEQNAYKAQVQDEIGKQGMKEGAGGVGIGLPNPEVYDFSRGKQNYNLFKGNTNVVSDRSNMNNGKPSAVVQQPAAQKTVPAIDASDPSSGMNAINAMYTSPEQEEKMRKASVNNQRILAIGDALRHIGNIYHTVNYSPSQQFNSPVAEEQQRYEKGKAVRDAANMRYYTYQQAKAAQDAKQKQWEYEYGLKMADAARKAGFTEAQIKNMQERLAQQKAYQEGSLNLRKEQVEAQKKHNEEMERQGRSRLSIQQAENISRNAKREWEMNGGGGKGNNQIKIRGKEGYYTLGNMSSASINAFYNQAFEALSKMNIIDEKKVSGSILPGLLGGSKIPASAKKEAVNNAIYNSKEAGEFIRQVFGFNLEEMPEYKNESQEQGTQQPNGNAPWRTPWYANGGGPFVGWDDDDLIGW